MTNSYRFWRNWRGLLDPYFTLLSATYSNPKHQPLKETSRSFNGGEFSEQDLKTMDVHSHAVRQLSLIGGIINAMEFSKSFLTADEK